ncbi:retrotransposon-related protein [Trifolium pratense]|uniref:Retrotransposon-related protein n=1 Tax=Trifolium pratense TaxID=57577 RepID=A0A2K3MNW9_TRIPR|nr:retrotransposon-related protein [Trifolium pratense]
MPNRKVTLTAFAKMESRVEALEGGLSEVRTTLADVQRTVKEGHDRLIAMMEKCIGKSIVVEEPGIGADQILQISPEKTKEESSNSHNEALVEFRHSAKRVELPSFDGDDPAGWISRAEVYFRVQNTTPAIKVSLSQLCMEGPTIHFFNSLLKENEDLSWDELKEALLERYGGHGEGDVYEQLTELRQEGTVEEYITDFEYLIAQIPKLPEKQFQGYFLHGLKLEIRGKVRSLVALGEMSRTKLMQVTRAVEKEIQGKSGTGLNRGPKHTNGSQKFGSNRNDWIFVRNKEAGGSGGVKSNNNGLRNEKNAQGDKRRSGSRDRGFNHLSYNELMERKQKGLCFKCGGPFHPMHQCPEKQLKVLIVDDEGEEEEIIAVEVDEEEEEVKGGMSILNLHHIAHENHQTMKFQGTIHGVEVLILVDSGATHNFVSQKLVHQMDWLVDDTPHLNVKLGNGAQIDTQGVCRELEVCIDEFKIKPKLHLFELGGIDVVLGMEWLKTLGDTITNWRQQTMCFWWDKKWITLKGQGGCRSTAVALQSILSRPKPKVAQEVFWETNNVKTKEGGNSSLSKTQQEELGKLLQKHEQAFQSPIGLPPKRSKDHAINLVEGHSAINVRPYRYPHHHKNEIERQIKEMLAAGIIRHSTSAYSSPVILVKKKDETWRMCIDYRALNKATIPDKFPIPVIEELLDELHGAKFFSKLDLKSGYHQVRVKDSDIEKTAFRTHEGHYEFMVMPFGLMNAPATFQSLMNEIFRPLLRKNVLVFFDDILIYSKDWVSHLSHLNAVLELLTAHSLVANRKKCFFGQRSVEYLGHVISEEGVAVDPGKVVSVLQWPQPKTVKGVRGFLGLTGYYRKFIRDYGRIARPLTNLTKKEGFIWGEEAQTAFEELKTRLTTAPVLALPDFSKNFVIECDASGEGIGAILMQEKKPIAYYSKALGMRNLTKSAYEKELMAVVLAIQHWRPYLLGRKFTVSTDQKSLKQLLQQRIVTAEQQNWSAKLLGYDFDIVYKQGKLNKGADALSRIHEGEINAMVSKLKWIQEEQIKTEIQADEKLSKIVNDILQDPRACPGYELRNGVLLYDGRLVISSKSLLIPVLLDEFHSSPQGGHSGFYKTYRRLAANIYWIGMKGTIQEYVRGCDVCQRQKYVASSPGGLLQPLPIPEQIWEDISMDFITGLPKSRGFEAILVVVDRLSKYSHFIPLKHPYTAKSIADVFCKEIVRLHGMPMSIVSDRDPIFISSFWKELFRMQGTKLKMSTSYHPESDGQTEVVNRCLETYLRCFISDQPRTWVNWVHWAEYWFNTTFHSSTEKTPYEVVYGRAPPSLYRWVQGETRVEAVQRDLLDRDEALRQLKAQLMRAQEKMKHQADKKRLDRSFVCGEWVFVKLRAHRQHSVVTRINAKLAARYYGPYPIIERIGAVAYKLKLPEGSRVHPVFHVSLLKKAVGNYHNDEDLPELMEELPDLCEPETILAVRKITQQGDEVKQVLVHWKGKTAEEATWEDELMIRSQFPKFALEDKVNIEGGGIDRTQTVEEEPLVNDSAIGPHTWLVYSRRKGKKGISG